MAAVGTDNSAATIVMIPSDFVTMAEGMTDYVQDHQTPAPAPTSAATPVGGGNYSFFLTRLRK